MSDTPAPEPLQLRSAIRGRERWQVSKLQRNSQLARALEQKLAAHRSVTNVKANPVTGRVLIVFDTANLGQAAGQVLRDALLQVTADIGEDDLYDLYDASDLTAIGKAGETELKILFALIKGTEDSPLLRKTATTLTVAVAALSITTPLMQGMIMASAIQGGLPILTSMGFGAVTQILIFAAGYFASAGLEKSLDLKRKQTWAEYALIVEDSLRLKAYRHIHGLSLTTLSQQEWGAADLARFVKEDSESVRRLLEFSGPTLMIKVATFAGCSAVLLAVAPIAFGLAVIPLPFMWSRARSYSRESREGYAETERREQVVDRRISNSLRGLPTVKSYTAEVWEQDRLQASNRAYQEIYEEVANQRSKHVGITETGFVMGVSLPTIYMSYQVVTGEMGILSFTSTGFMVPRMVLAATGFDADYANYLDAKRAAARLHQLFAQPLEPFSGEPLDAQEVKGEIRFENVSFHYPKSIAEPVEVVTAAEEFEPILNHVNVTIPPGSTVAFVGSTGSGKSTLIRLLLRFYEPTEGRILLDGRDIRDLDVFDLRRALGWVSQEVYLFEGTIAENIRYGTADASDAQVQRVAELAVATRFIEAKDGGMSYQVGEQGQALSGGQRQRISVARALLKDAPILILDEATSAVDNDTEEEMHKAILGSQRERTHILVAHRLSSLSKADTIHVMEEGEICESGTHDELLANDGRYAQLWRLQISHEGESAPD